MTSLCVVPMGPFLLPLRAIWDKNVVSVLEFLTLRCHQTNHRYFKINFLVVVVVFRERNDLDLLSLLSLESEYPSYFITSSVP